MPDRRGDCVSVGEMLWAATASFGGLLAAEMLGAAELEEGGKYAEANQHPHHRTAPLPLPGNR